MHIITILDKRFTRELKKLFAHKVTIVRLAAAYPPHHRGYREHGHPETHDLAQQLQPNIVHDNAWLVMPTE